MSILEIMTPDDIYSTIGIGFPVSVARARLRDEYTVGVDTVLTRKPPAWLIPGFLQEGATAQLVGPFAGGKSLLTLHWCAQLVKAGRSVLYCAAEGMSGFNGRLRALMAEHGGTGPDLAGLRFYERPVNLLDKDAAAHLAEIVALTGPWDVVVIDTLARATAGGDENSAGDMSLAIERVESLKGDKGAVLVVHHAGWTGKRGRGSTAIPSANDNIVHCFPAGDFDGKEGRDLVLKVEAEKIKDGRKSEAVYFRLQEHNLGALPDGTPWTSVALTETAEPTDPGSDLVLEQFMRQGGGRVTVAQLADLMGKSRPTADRMLRAAGDAVLVVGKEGHADVWGLATAPHH